MKTHKAGKFELASIEVGDVFVNRHGEKLENVVAITCGYLVKEGGDRFLMTRAQLGGGSVSVTVTKSDIEAMMGLVSPRVEAPPQYQDLADEMMDDLERIRRQR